MDKIFQQAKDKNVAALLFYKDANSYICSDSEAKVKMSKAEVIDAFKKRAFLVDSGSYLVPSKLVVSTDYASIVFAGLGAVGADITLYSEEYSPL